MSIRISKIPSIKRKNSFYFKNYKVSFFCNPCNKNDVTMMFIYPLKEKKMKTLKRIYVYNVTVRYSQKHYHKMERSPHPEGESAV